MFYHVPFNLMCCCLIPDGCHVIALLLSFIYSHRVAREFKRVSGDFQRDEY